MSSNETPFSYDGGQPGQAAVMLIYDGGQTSAAHTIQHVVGGVHTVIKDGIAYDAKALLTDVRNMVKDAKQQEQAQP